MSALERSSQQGSRWMEFPVVVVLVGKVLAGVLAALAIVLAWGVWSPPDKGYANQEGVVLTASGPRPATETEVAGWADTRDYGVLYPLMPGDDAEKQLPPVPNKIWTAVTRDLYPILDEAGAIYIDAQQYREGLPPSQVLPAAAIKVNLNYIGRYPILGEDHQPIVVDPAEPAWVVAVPATLKSQQAEIEGWYLKLRRGLSGFQSVSDAEARMIGDTAPDRFRNQEVRIIWTEPGQNLFSFDSGVNPSGGNVILDPIVEIMTPMNSLPVDRLNTVTGGPDTALKVFTGGDPAGTFARLLPELQRLQLEDNLRQLVFANEAPLMRLDIAEAESRISRATAVSVALAMVAMGAASAVMIVARLRRVLIVRRLHGFSLVRRNRELLVAGGLSTLGMLVFGGLVLLGDRTGVYALASYRGISSGDVMDISLRLGGVILVLSAAELLLALVVAAVIQRRTGALLVKQL